MEKTKDAYYFSHDANARNDSKMLRVRRELGLEGYGIYFCLVEILREQKDFCLDLVNLVDIAYSLHVDEAKVKAVVLDYDLFETTETTFFSSRLIESMEKYKSLSLKRIEAGKKGGMASAKQRSSKGQATVDDTSTIKGKESKGKERKVNKKKVLKKVFIPPTLEEVKAYVSEKKKNVDVDKFFEYFTESNWIDSNDNPVTNWKLKIITWSNNGQTGTGQRKATAQTQKLGADEKDYAGEVERYEREKKLSEA